jgi:hypothetical protein
MGALMTVNDRWRFDAPNRSAAKDDDLLRVSIAHHLRNFCFENLDVIDFLKTPANTHRISGAILYSLEPKQIRLLIDDARTSIVLALQRHFGNERYRKRLMTETHYRILRPHMSAGFRVLMMPPSNWDGYHFPVSRKPNLVVAYQNEIDRLRTSPRMFRAARAQDRFFGEFPFQ